MNPADLGRHRLYLVFLKLSKPTASLNAYPEGSPFVVTEVVAKRLCLPANGKTFGIGYGGEIRSYTPR
jgi:hypothetical protein